MRNTREPHSVHMLENSKGTTFPITSIGELSRELLPSIPSPKFAGSVSVKSTTSYFIQRMLHSTKDLNFSPSVGIGTAIS